MLAKKHENWKRARAMQQEEINRMFNWTDAAKIAVVGFVVQAILRRMGLSVRKVSFAALIVGLFQTLYKHRALPRSFQHKEEDYPRWPIVGQISIIPDVFKYGASQLQIDKSKKNDFVSHEVLLLGNPRDMSIMDPRDREYILKTNWKNFVKNSGNGNGFQDKFAEFLGRGIFAVVS